MFFFVENLQIVIFNDKLDILIYIFTYKDRIKITEIVLRKRNYEAYSLISGTVCSVCQWLPRWSANC